MKYVVNNKEYTTAHLCRNMNRCDAVDFSESRIDRLKE